VGHREAIARVRARGRGESPTPAHSLCDLPTRTSPPAAPHPLASSPRPVSFSCPSRPPHKHVRLQTKTSLFRTGEARATPKVCFTSGRSCAFGTGRSSKARAVRPCGISLSELLLLKIDVAQTMKKRLLSAQSADFEMHTTSQRGGARKFAGEGEREGGRERTERQEHANAASSNGDNCA
jgi:hypothetical protein